MHKLTYTELFLSQQSEGRFVGAPSIFLRTYGCNFRCKLFGRERDADTSCHNPEVSNVINNITLYKTFEELPLLHTGCDTYSSVYPEFKSFSKKETVDVIAEKMTELLPNKRWIQSNGNDVHLVITGGEPLLGWQRAYGELFEQPCMQDIRNVTFETNGTQELSDDFKHTLDALQLDGDREVTFSVSPKLSASGEKWEDAIKPEIVRSYEDYGHTYLKFVVETPEDFNEVDKATAEYRSAGFTGVVYVMPSGGTVETYNKNMTNVALMAIERGYYFSPRLQVTLFGNSWGT